MDYIYIGKIVSTHGIKGELRLISNFDYKELVFKKNTPVYIGKDKIKETIVTYRPHKNYDMVCLYGYNNINDVLKYKGEKVYVVKNEVDGLNKKVTKQELLGFDVYLCDNRIGTVKDIYSTGNDNYVVEIIKENGKKVLAPFALIDEVDSLKRQVTFKGGIIDA